MPITHQGTTCYSIEELLERTHLPPSAVRRCLEDTSFAGALRLNDSVYITEDALSDFFEQCFSHAGVAPSCYAMPDDLQHAASPWTKALLEMYRHPFAFGTSLSPQQGRVLHTLVANMQPRNIVEIGSFIGISSIWMAAGFSQDNSAGTLHAIDLFYEIMPCYPYRSGYLKDPLSFAESAANAAHLAERIRFYRMNSYEVGRQIDTLFDFPIDLLFIDGDHSIRGCMNDFALFAPSVSPGGIIVLHDIYPDVCGYQGPRYLLDRVIRNSTEFKVIELTTAPRNYGMAIIQKTAQRIRPWHSFGYWKLAHIRLKARVQQTHAWTVFKTHPFVKMLRKAL